MSWHKFFNDALIYLLLWLLTGCAAPATIHLRFDSQDKMHEWRREHPNIRLLDSVGTIYVLPGDAGEVQ
jgi:hypothetical protein